MASDAAVRRPIEQPERSATLQVGALCWRRSAKGEFKILLITSRDSGRWVIPKGWPMRRLTEAEAAAREAFEEAGVRGVVTARSLGLFAYEKGIGKGRALACLVRVYPLEVREQLRSFPETGQRRVKWYDQARAARRVSEPELAAIIRGFAPEPDACSQSA